MPKTTIEHLEGWSLSTVTGEAAVRENGQPLHNGDGSPKTVPTLELVFRDPMNPGNEVRWQTAMRARAVAGMLQELDFDTRREAIELATGVAIADASDLPPSEHA